MQTKQPLVRTFSTCALAAILALLAAPAWSQVGGAFIPRLINTSTIPPNGDVNPYGVAFVPRGFPTGGAIAAGDVLVSNFNNSANLQGTGTTIVQFRPSGDLAPPGTATVFFSSVPVGLTTALGVLRAGFVIVGNLPTADGTSATIGPGALQVIDRNGNLLHTWADPDGPWDLAVDDNGARAHVFVSNVLSGNVVRLDVAVVSGNLTLLGTTTIARGYSHRSDPAALVVGPTGLAYDGNADILYVASTEDNAIYSVAHASGRTTSVNKGNLVFSDAHLRGPLALRFAPNGDLLTANGDAINSDPLHPSVIVECTTSGRFVREYNVDSSQGGAFGLDTVLADDAPFNYAAIDDVTNTLSVYHMTQE